MSIQLNPMAQAEIELQALLRTIVPASQPEAKTALIQGIMYILERAVVNEKLMLGEHEQCGADNPEGTTALCKCPCHKGHYRHRWEPVIKTPVQSPDGSFYLLDRCKYCPDMRFKVIKPSWTPAGEYQMVSLEYTVRGEHRVLTKEEFISKKPELFKPELQREKPI